MACGRAYRHLNILKEKVNARGDVPMNDEGVSQVQILLTERCNIQCLHCAVPSEDSPADDELGADEWQKLFESLVSSGVTSIVINGGEALLRPDAVEILRRAFAAGIPWGTLITNGLLFNRRVADGLSVLQTQYPAFQIHVSLDGATAGTHEWMRGEGTWHKTMKSIERLQAAGGRVNGVNSVIHAINLHEFDDLARLAKDLGASIWTVFPNADLGRGAALGDQHLDAATWTELFEAGRRVEECYGLYVSIGGPVYGDEWPETALEVPKPKVPRPDKVLIGPDGDAFTCPPLRGVSLGRAAGAGAADWTTVSSRARHVLDEACSSCKYLLVCTGVDLADPLWKRPGPFGRPRTSLLAERPVVIRSREGRVRP